MLGVNQNTIDQFGAVSEQVAQEMAEGALKQSKCQLSIAITGIAGPTGGTEDKPVGTVCFAFAGASFETNTSTQLFKGDRQSVREQAVEYALKECLEIC